MNEVELGRLTLTEAAALIGSRQVSPLELTTACIERAQRLDGRLNAFLTPTFDSALREASAATEEIARGKHRGPLHGMPFGLKDLFETAGVRTTAGSPLRDDYVPEADAQVVAKLKDAGVVSLGKLNMHEWAMGTTGVNAFYPSPRNPWDTSRLTGGSSGGSAVAIAAGFCLGTLGSDTRGSIRIPSSLCGITGLKPTYGRVSLRGVVPLVWSLDHAGPMARSAADCALILQAIAGFDFEDPTSAEVPAPNYAAGLDRGIEGVRVGLPRGDFFDAKAIDAEVLAAVEVAAKQLESLGAIVSEVEFPDRSYYEDRGVFLAEAYAYHEERIKNQSDKIGPSVMSRVRGVEGATAIDYSRARYRQLEYKREVRRLFRDIDLLLTPTTASAALPFPRELDAIPAAQLARNTGTFNILGVPAISVPCGFTSDDLPIGMQLSGRWWEEALVLRAAHAYQRETDWHLRAPRLD